MLLLLNLVLELVVIVLLLVVVVFVLLVILMLLGVLVLLLWVLVEILFVVGVFEEFCVVCWVKVVIGMRRVVVVRVGSSFIVFFLKLGVFVDYDLVVVVVVVDLD